MTCIQTSNNK